MTHTCVCGHAARRHQDGDGICLISDCDCTRFNETGTVSTQPAAAPRVARPLVTPGLFVRAARSKSQQTRNLGLRIKRELDRLHALLDAEEKKALADTERARLQAATRAEILRLRQQLKDACAKLDPPGRRGQLAQRGERGA